MSMWKCVCVFCEKFECNTLRYSTYSQNKFTHANMFDHNRKYILCVCVWWVRARECIQGTNLHVLHIKNASLDILISYSYEELLQMKRNEGVGECDGWTKWQRKWKRRSWTSFWFYLIKVCTPLWFKNSPSFSSSSSSSSSSSLSFRLYIKSFHCNFEILFKKKD